MSQTYNYEQKSFSETPQRLLFVVLFLLNVLVWVLVVSPDHGGLFSVPWYDKLRLDFINVGQGDAILIRTPQGRNYLIDGGTNITLSEAQGEGRELIQGYLRKVGVRRLHGLLVTHPHNDHLGGLIPVLRRMAVDEAWECGAGFNTPVYKTYLELCETRRIPRKVVREGEMLDWGKGLFVQVLHPAKVKASEQFADLNNMSVVLMLRYGKFSCLLPGDAETEAETELTRYGDQLACSLVKLPHHGSNTSIYPPFLELIKPQVGIIQVGERNSFGHPCPETLGLYQKMGVRVFRNDRHGTIRVEVGGKTPQDFEVKVDRGG